MFGDAEAVDDDRTARAAVEAGGRHQRLLWHAGYPRHPVWRVVAKQRGQLVQPACPRGEEFVIGVPFLQQDAGQAVEDRDIGSWPAL
jgi:hypothetical protein